MKNSVLTTRLSYTASEVAGQLIFCVVSFYLLKFYTDVYGISAAAAGTILLLARSVDAIDAPLWGILFDKTHSRWGKSRPWFLWLCVPFAFFGVLTFVTPSFGAMAKVIYAAATYVVCSILYTGINTPVTSILSALTGDTHERITLTSFRMFGSKLGVLIVNLTVLKMVTWLGRGNDRLGFMLVMPMYACGTVLLYLLAFRNLKEVVTSEKHRLSIRQSFAALHGNGPWFIIFFSSFFFWIAFVSRISAAPYFFQYVLRRKDLISVANSLDVISLATIVLLPWFCRRFTKRTVWVASLAGAIVSQVVIQAGVAESSSAIVMTGWSLGFLTSGVAMAIPFSTLSDSVDYGEWKRGVRAVGLLTALGAAFCLKAGSGLGGALPAWILSWYSYVPNVEQTQRSLHGIELSFIWLPALCYALAAIPVFFYYRYECLELRIRKELEQRRSMATAISSSV
ncbi:glycoside-pentoside-hexuronide (GPH):cation symporter [Pseudacidobacterium ailaaui]|jgi:sugar (glycoside-pentoside-hexuronide) transporter|uniref:glycoside-pentoside-hexuronide (GPH):cation symporter n=1 Tax=Pseudacidobacterium ailaaui TaxID=1382359 RepID=UPI0005D28971|nr:MFS transporter [Pseudacidobacterium ailaaui]